MRKIYIITLLLAQSMMMCAQKVHVGGLVMQAPFIQAPSTQAPVSVEGKAPATVARPRAMASTERAVGYTVGDSITTKGAYVGQAGTYFVGASATTSMLADYKGCKVVGMRFAVSESIGRSNVYIYKVEDNKATSVLNVPVRRTYEGWNEVRFNSGLEYTLGENDELIFGFDYNETADMALAQEGALCFYTPKNENANASLILLNGAFYNMSGMGNLCVQLIVDVSNLPKKDVRLTHLLAGNKYKKPGETIDTYVQFNNIGLEDIATTRFGYRIDNGATSYVDASEAVKAGEIGSVSAEIKLPSDIKVGSHKLTFFADKLDGNAAKVTEGDTLVNNFVVYTKSMKRQQSYVEQYCSANSYIASVVNDQMNMVADDDTVCLVNIYRDEEPLAVADASYLHRLYSYTYPCFTIDRYYFLGESYIAFDVNDYAMLLPTLVGDAVRSLVAEARLTNPSFATVNIRPSYNEATRKLALDVTGDATDEAQEVLGNLGLTLMLTENGVVSPQVVINDAGDDTETNDSYVHNHVLRAYLTAATGDKLTLANGKYSAHFEYTLPAAWNADNMTAVALLSKYLPAVTDDNVLEADIVNANSVSVKGASTGISGVKAEATAADGVYTIDGRRVEAAAMRHGIYLVRKNGVARKVLVK